MPHNAVFLGRDSCKRKRRKELGSIFEDVFSIEKSKGKESFDAAKVGVNLREGVGEWVVFILLKITKIPTKTCGKGR